MPGGVPAEFAQPEPALTLRERQRSPLRPEQREARPGRRGVCPECGTPTATYRGTVHGWRCTACVTRVVGVAFRPDDPRERRDREGVPVPPGCDAYGRPIIPMNTTTTEVSR